MLVTILYFSYYSTSKNGSVVGNPWSLLFIYSCVHIIELMYMLSIYSVFFIYSTSQEYKNLRFIGELGKCFELNRQSYQNNYNWLFKKENNF